MISRLILITASALMFYAVLPALASFWRKRKWHVLQTEIASRMDAGSGALCAVCGFANGKIAASRIEGPHKNETVSIDPALTKFLLLRCDKDQKHPSLQPLRWKNVQSIEAGERLWYAPNPGSHDADTCLILDPSAQGDVRIMLETSRPERLYIEEWKYWPVAAGIFIEFLILMHSLYAGSLTIVTAAAVIAIFGKALPYLPPGLLFTLAAQFLLQEGGDEGKHHRKSAEGSAEQAKKNRQRAAAGILLTSAGIILNLALLFFILGRIGVAFV